MRETLVPHVRLAAFTASCLEKLGLASADARLVAETLVASNLRGVDSHGVVRLPHYATRLRNGTVKPRPNIAVQRTGPSAAVVEGDAGMGQLVATRAMQEAISLAKGSGVGAVVARNSSHCGACAWFVEMAVKEGMVGLALTHTDPIMVPPGMKRIFLGSNPIAFGAPGGGGPPVIVDMSTTHAAWGKVIVARQEGKPIPPDWAVDAEGRSTTDAAPRRRPRAHRRAQGLRARHDGGDPLRAARRRAVRPARHQDVRRARQAAEPRALHAGDRRRALYRPFALPLTN